MQYIVYICKYVVYENMYCTVNFRLLVPMSHTLRNILTILYISWLLPYLSITMRIHIPHRFAWQHLVSGQCTQPNCIRNCTILRRG